MIFVTVGTHEQAFDRLIENIDKLVENKVITEEVIVQIGYSNYQPKNCVWHRFIPGTEMQRNIENARIVITHGGPASYIMALLIGKIPVVVPRLKRFDEHVNDHQLEFSTAVSKRQKNIIVVEDIEKLGETIINYDSITAKMPKEMKSNNEKFNEKFEEIIKGLFE